MFLGSKVQHIPGGYEDKMYVYNSPLCYTLNRKESWASWLQRRHGTVYKDSFNVVCNGNSVVTYLIISVCLIHILTESRLPSVFS